MSLGWLKKRHMKPASTDSNIICFFSKRLDEGSGGIRGAFSRGIRGGSGSIWPGDPGGSGGIRGDPRTLCEDGPTARAAGSMLFYCVRHENGQSARSGWEGDPDCRSSRIIILRTAQETFGDQEGQEPSCNVHFRILRTANSESPRRAPTCTFPHVLRSS